MPKISIAIPIHDTPKTAFFLSRLLSSIDKQSFKDYEIVITKEGAMAHNHNAAILKSKGEIVKLMQMDDYFGHGNALEEIITAFVPGTEWVISGSLHDYDGTVKNYHSPYWTDDIYTGNNRLGSISTLSFKKQMLFEEPLTWLVDCDLYYRMYLKYGKPTILDTPNVIIDTRTDRLSHTLSDELKANEVDYLQKKYG